MDIKNLLNATESAKFLGLKNRTEFYPLKEMYRLKSYKRIGNVSLYSKNDLRKIKDILKNN